MGERTQLRTHYDSHIDAEEEERMVGSYREVRDSGKVVEDSMKEKCQDKRTDSENRYIFKKFSSENTFLHSLQVLPR